MNERSRTVPQTDDFQPTCELCDEPLAMTWSRAEGEVWHCKNHPAKPRALVAISEDRQWLCALEPELEDKRATSIFSIWQWDIRAGHILQGVEVDTGQSADEVLATFLAGREE